MALSSSVKCDRSGPSEVAVAAAASAARAEAVAADLGEEQDDRMEAPLRLVTDDGDGAIAEALWNSAAAAVAAAAAAAAAGPNGCCTVAMPLCQVGSPMTGLLLLLL